MCKGFVQVDIFEQEEIYVLRKQLDIYLNEGYFCIIGCFV